ATRRSPAAYHATTIGQYALAHWNAHLASGAEGHRHAFMRQAHWLVANEVRLDRDAGGWPIPYRWPDWHAPGPWLSALTQGVGISVLARAHRLTGDDAFREVMGRALGTLERDILDGG